MRLPTRRRPPLPGPSHPSRILAFDADIVADVGAYPYTGGFIPDMTCWVLAGPYATPRLHVRARAVVTNKAPTASYRGAGRPEAAYFVERTIDLLAERLGRDPAEVRRRNFIRDDAFPYASPTGAVYDSGRYASALGLALGLVDYRALRAEQRRRRGLADGGAHDGADDAGPAAPLLGIGIGSWIERSGGARGLGEFAEVEVAADGVITARVGTSLPLRPLRPFWPAHAGAAGRPHRPVGHRGRLHAAAGLPLRQLRRRGRGGQADRQVTISRLAAVDDCGVVINPGAVDGQVIGSIAQGVGQALYERVVYDENGKAPTATLLDYFVPAAAEMPDIVRGEHVTPNPNVPLGTKGAGESGCIGAPPAIANAVWDALAGYDRSDLQLPLTPDRVWQCLQRPLPGRHTP